MYKKTIQDSRPLRTISPENGTKLRTRKTKRKTALQAKSCLISEKQGFRGNASSNVASAFSLASFPVVVRKK